MLDLLFGLGARYIADIGVPVMRYSNREDSVTYAPSRTLDYVHAGVEYYEHLLPNGNTEIKICSQEYDEDPKCGLRPNALYSFARHFFK